MKKLVISNETHEHIKLRAHGTLAGSTQLIDGRWELTVDDDVWEGLCDALPDAMPHDDDYLILNALGVVH